MNTPLPNDDPLDDPLDELLDEMLSAYLDGEAAAHERERVERALNESSQVRNRLQELRQLSCDIGALPRRRLDADFPQRVLRQAERQMLRGGESATNNGIHSREFASPDHSDDRRDPGIVPFQEIAAVTPQTRSPQRFVPRLPARWLHVAAAVMVLAPALALMALSTRDRKSERSVAQGSPDPQKTSTPQDSVLSDPQSNAGDKSANNEKANDEKLRAVESLQDGNGLNELPQRQPIPEEHRTLRRANGRASSKSEPLGNELGKEFEAAPFKGGGSGGATAAPAARLGGATGNVAGMAADGPDDATPDGGGMMVVHVTVTQKAWRGMIGRLFDGKDVSVQSLQEPERKILKFQGTSQRLQTILSKLNLKAKSQKQGVIALAVQPPRKSAEHWFGYNFRAEFKDESSLARKSGKSDDVKKKLSADMKSDAKYRRKATDGEVQSKLKKSVEAAGKGQTPKRESRLPSLGKNGDRGRSKAETKRAAPSKNRADAPGKNRFSAKSPSNDSNVENFSSQRTRKLDRDPSNPPRPKKPGSKPGKSSAQAGRILDKLASQSTSAKRDASKRKTNPAQLRTRALFIFHVLPNRAPAAATVKKQLRPAPPPTADKKQ